MSGPAARISNMATSDHENGVRDAAGQSTTEQPNVDALAPVVGHRGAAAAAVNVFNNNVPFPEPLSLAGNVRQNVDDFIDGFETHSFGARESRRTSESSYV